MVVKTNYGAQIDFLPGTFVSKSENQAIEFDLNIIELKSYADHILQNADHYNQLITYNHIQAIYFDARLNNNSLDILSSKNVILRFPSEQLYDKLVLGRGSIENGSLLWDFGIEELTNTAVYTNWTEVSDSGESISVSGYEIEITKPGWYAIANLIPEFYIEYSICIELPSSYSELNTISYLVLNNYNYLTKLNFVSDSEFCSEKIRLPEDSIGKIISISELESGEFYYSENVISPQSMNFIIEIDPSLISKDELKNRLLNL